MIYYLTYARPQKENFARYQEIANELMCVLATYPLFCFTAYVQDLDRRVEAGWLLVGSILLNVVFNMVLLIYQVILLSYKKIKYWYLRRIAKRKFEEAKEEKRLADEERNQLRALQVVKHIEAKM